MVGILLSIHSWRQHVADKYETRTRLDFVDGIVEHVAVVDSMQEGRLDVSLVIINKRDFEIMVAAGCNEHVFSIEVRYDYGFDEGNAKEDGVVRHVQIVVREQLL